MSISRRQFNVAVLGVGLTGLSPALSFAAGKPLLTIDGNIAPKQGEQIATFERETLEALGMHAFQTTCPWYTGLVKFEGPLMRDVLGAAKASGDKVMVQALNDYTTEIPFDDFKTFDVILAMKRDGAYMPVRDKGPLFIVYPYDSKPELKTQQYFKRSAWQVARMTVK